MYDRDDLYLSEAVGVWDTKHSFLKNILWLA